MGAVLASKNLKAVVAEKGNQEIPIYDQVLLKKYFYVIRPLLAVRWIDQGLGPVPVEFSRLLKLLPDELMSTVDDLLVRKSQAELLAAPPIAQIDEWISGEIFAHGVGKHVAWPGHPGHGPLDDFLLWALEDVYGLRYD